MPSSGSHVLVSHCSCSERSAALPRANSCPDAASVPFSAGSPPSVYASSPFRAHQLAFPAGYPPVAPARHALLAVMAGHVRFKMVAPPVCAAGRSLLRRGGAQCEHPRPLCSEAGWRLVDSVPLQRRAASRGPPTSRWGGPLVGNLRLAFWLPRTGRMERRTLWGRCNPSPLGRWYAALSHGTTVQLWHGHAEAAWWRLSVVHPRGGGMAAGGCWCVQVATLLRTVDASPHRSSPFNIHTHTLVHTHTQPHGLSVGALVTADSASTGLFICVAIPSRSPPP